MKILRGLRPLSRTVRGGPDESADGFRVGRVGPIVLRPAVGLNPTRHGYGHGPRTTVHSHDYDHGYG